MVNYENGKIYGIFCRKTGLCYIGSTCYKHLSKRRCNHEYDYRQYLVGKRGYLTSFKVLENGDYYCEILETYPCNNNYELLKRERYWIEKMDCCVNKMIPTRTYKERYNDNKEHINKTNLDNYYKHHTRNLNRKKLYREANKERIQESLMKHNTIVNCECGSTLTKYKLNRHKKTKKHQSYLATLHNE